MGAQEGVNRRVVFDTNTVISPLLFAGGCLAWLRQHWRDGACVPLISRAAATELVRVLRYPKFGLSMDDGRELLAEYLPYSQVVEPRERCAVVSRDAGDQAFLELAQSGRADMVVSGDRDLLRLAESHRF